MSETIDQKVVEMKFDNTQFESGVKTSLSTIDKLRQSLNFDGAAKGLDSVSAAARSCDLSPLTGAVQTVQAKFSALQVMAITALSNITNSAVNAGRRLISAFTIDPIKSGFHEYETQINAVQTILANTESKGSTLQDVNAALNELNTYADKTIYNFTEMTRNIGTFTAAGVGLKTSTAAIKGIANLAAVSGSNAQQASTAMYQLSQAMASGTVKLMDWNSVVNAGMGGQVFQDALKETARVHGIKIDEMIKKEGSFRETLKKGWLTTNILTETLSKFTGDLNEKQLKSMGYTDKQIKSILKMGQTANDAATKVKTFSQLMDTLKEAAQSGWTQSWQLIIGDFGEAKETLTELSDMFGKMISKSANARNAILSGGLSTGWNQLLTQGISDEEGFTDSLTKVAKKHGVAIDDMIKKDGSLKDSLKEGWVTGGMLGEAINDMANKTKGLSDEQLTNMGYTRQQAEELQKLNVRIKNGTINLEDYAKKMQMKSGRQNLFEALNNSLKALLSIVQPIKKAFIDIFPTITGEQIYNMTVKLKEFTATLKLSKGTSENLKNTFKGVFAILDIGKQILEGVFRAITPLFGGAKDLAGGFLGITGNVGETVAAFDKFIKKAGIFNTIGQGIGNILQFLIDNFKKFAGAVKAKLDTVGFETVHALLKRIHDRVHGVSDAVQAMKAGTVQAFATMSTAIANSKFYKFFQGAWKLVQSVTSGIVKMVTSAAKTITDKIGKSDFKGVIDIINGVFAAINGIEGFKFLKSAKDAAGEFKEGAKQFKGIMKSVGDTIGTFQKKVKADILIRIATAVGILAASLLIISMIDSKKLLTSMAAITAMFVELELSFKVLDKIGGNKASKSVNKNAKTMVVMATAVLIMATAMKQVGNLDWGQVARGLVSLGAMTAMLVAAAKIMGKNSKEVAKGAGQMVIFATAIKILAGACKELATLSWNEMAKGLTGVGTLIFALSKFISKTDFSQKTFTTMAGLVLLAGAVKILASACSEIAGISTGGLVKGLAAISIFMFELSKFTTSTSNSKGMIQTGIGMMGVATAMKILAGAIQKLGSMSLADLAKGVIGMSVALAAITIAVRNMPKDGMIGTGTGLMIVSTALVILSKALSNMGSMSWDELARGLTVLGGSLVILGVALKAMQGTLSGSAALIVAAGAIAILAPALSLLGSMSGAGVATALIALAGAFTILGVSAAILTPLVPTILALGGACALVGVGVLAMGAGLMAAGAGLSAIAVGITALVAALSGGITIILSALSAIVMGIANLIPQILTKVGEGLLALIKVIADNVPAIIDAVVKIGSAILDAIIKLVPKIAQAIGVIIVGVLDVLVTALPRILDAALKLVAGFLNGIAQNIGKIISAGVNVVLAFIKGIIGQIPKIVNAAFKIVTSFINALGDTFKNQTPKLMVAVVKLAGDIVEGLALGLFKGVAKIGKAAFSLGKSVITGLKSALKSHSPSKETMDIGMFAAIGLANGIRDFTGTAVDSAAKLGTSIVTALKDVLQIHSPSKVTRDEVGQYVVQGIAEGITKDMSAEDAATKKADNIVNAFKTELDKADLSSTTADLEYQLWGKLNASASEPKKAAMEMQTLAKQVQFQNQKVQLAQGEYNVTLKTFGPSSQKTQEAYNKLLQQQIALADLAEKLNTSQKNVSAQNTNALQEYASYINDNKDNLLKMGFTMEQIKAAAAERTGYDPNWLNGGAMAATAQNAVTGAMSTVQGAYAKNAKGTFGSLVGSYNNYGAAYVDAMAKGIQNGSPKVISLTDAMVKKCEAKLSAHKPQWSTLGKGLVDGFVEGIRGNIQNAAQAAAEMAKAAYNAAMAAIGVHSPSTAYAELGKNADLGFAKGLLAYSGVATDASSKMSKGTLSGLKSALKQVQAIVENGIDPNPTIRPVLDLKTVENQANKLTAFFSRTHAVSIGMSMSENESGDTGTSVSSTTSNTTNNFYQNNYSPKALSRLEIYRQTRNQIKLLKGATT